MMQMSIKTLELQKASLEAMRGACAAQRRTETGAIDASRSTTVPGSPYAWRVQLALEHKALPYERKVLSFSAGDTRKPEFLALNPRHRVPVIVDGDFVLYESNAIVEYLDDAYPGRGAPLFPGDARQRALVRRLIAEVDNYFDKATDPVVDEAFSKKPEERDAGEARGRRARRCARSSRCSRATCAATSSPGRCRPRTSRSIRWSRSSIRCAMQAAGLRRRRRC